VLIERNKSIDVELSKCNRERDDHNKIKVADINRVSPCGLPLYFLFAAQQLEQRTLGSMPQVDLPSASQIATNHCCNNAGSTSKVGRYKV